MLDSEDMREYKYVMIKSNMMHASHSSAEAVCYCGTADNSSHLTSLFLRNRQAIMYTTYGIGAHWKYF